MTTAPTVPIDELLRHRAWVRALARSLVRDDATADDVEQDVWVRAMRRPPRAAGAARMWLGRVVHSVVRDRHRSDSRRTAREAARPPAQEPETAVDIVARAEAHRDLVSEVLTLPDAYRRVILMRFFDGLSPGEIAAQTGARPETVRKQVQRARAMLRDRIESGREGGLHALALPLVGSSWLAQVSAAPGGAGTVATVAVGGVAVTAKSKATVVVLVLLLLGLMGGAALLVIGDDTSDPTPGDETAVLDATDRGPGDASPAEPASAAGGQDATDSDHATANAPEPAAKNRRPRVTTESDSEPETTVAVTPPVAIPDSAPGELRGLVVDAAGRAVQGATVVAFRDSEQLGVTQVGADGTFRLADLPQGDLRVGVSAPGYVRTRLETRAGGAGLRVALDAAHPIHGVVVDARSGEPVAGAPVYLFPAANPDTAALDVAHTDAEGRFELTNAPDGTFDVQVGYRMSRFEGTFAYVPARVAGVRSSGEPLEIRLDQGLEISGRFIDAHSEVVTGDFDVRVRGRTEHGDRDQSRSRLLRTDGDGTFRVTGLEEGTFDLTFSPAEPREGEEAPRVGGTRTLESVAAGTAGIDVRLGRQATISGRLIDENGQPVRAPKGWMQAIPAGTTPGDAGTVWVTLAEDGTFTTPPLDANRSYDLQAGMVPGHRTGKLTGVAPGATDVMLRMPRATSISGRVLGPDGKAVGAGVPVLAIAEDVSLDGTPGSVAFTYTDASGAFSIEGLGEFTFQIAAGGGTSRFRPKAVLRGVSFGTADAKPAVVAGVVLSGRLLDAQGSPVKAPYLCATRPGLLQFESHTRVETDDGSFEIASLPPGKLRIAVVIGDQRHDLGEIEVPATGVELRLPE